jgi:hypothetical protein
VATINQYWYQRTNVPTGFVIRIRHSLNVSSPSG